MRLFESYHCGCASSQSSKFELSGYCATHGKDAAQVYRADGKLIWDHRNDAPVSHPAVRIKNYRKIMTRNSPKTKIKHALDAVHEQMRVTTSNDKYSRGLSGEGYAGGYAAALSDVLLVLDGCPPCVRPEYWRKEN